MWKQPDYRSDATQCDLCLADGRTRPQHGVLEVESNGVSPAPAGEAAVMVNGPPASAENTACKTAIP